MIASRHLPIAVMLAIAVTTPALANYFSNPETNTNLNIGSAPSPTPDDLRRIEQGVHPFLNWGPNGLIGKPVYSMNREYLGSIRAVDANARVAQMELAGGVMVALTERDIRDAGDRVILPEMSRRDVLDRAQASGQGR